MSLVNQEQNNEYMRRYNKTPQGRMRKKILRWKKWGIKLPEGYGENWVIFYEQEYLGTTHCEECDIELTEDRYNTPTTRCLDHDHYTGKFRNILCFVCNIKRR
tara:strand:- start:387 stop:695 length:309 start_codon:yes stop_codon:yes gene_type:complete